MEYDSSPEVNKGPRVWLTLLVALASAGAGFGGLWLFQGRAAPPPPPPPVAPVAAPGLDAAAEPPAVALPPVEKADAMIREVAARIASAPGFAAWMAQTDLARRFTASVEAVADGGTPRASLGFLAPSGPFKVAQRQGHTFIDPASFARYDGVAAVVDSLDDAAAARAYRTLHPLLEAAYREIGRPGTTLDGRLAAALDRLLATPVPAEPVELISPAVSYKYADPKLEELSASSKHLLRMGPHNMVLVQSRLRQLSAALELQPH